MWTRTLQDPAYNKGTHKGEVQSNFVDEQSHSCLLHKLAHIPCHSCQCNNTLTEYLLLYLQHCSHIVEPCDADNLELVQIYFTEDRLSTYPILTFSPHLTRTQLYHSGKQWKIHTSLVRIIMVYHTICSVDTGGLLPIGLCSCHIPMIDYLNLNCYVYSFFGYTVKDHMQNLGLVLGKL